MHGLIVSTFLEMHTLPQQNVSINVRDELQCRKNVPLYL
jgi:hypothetical protein